MGFKPPPHPGDRFRCQRCGQSECWCEVGHEPHVAVARAAATCGQVSWYGLVLVVALFAGWHAGKARAWWGVDESSAPSASSTVGEHRTTNISGGHTYVGPVYESGKKVGSSDGQSITSNSGRLIHAGPVYVSEDLRVDATTGKLYRDPKAAK